MVSANADRATKTKGGGLSSYSFRGIPSICAAPGFAIVLRRAGVGGDPDDFSSPKKCNGLDGSECRPARSVEHGLVFQQGT